MEDRQAKGATLPELTAQRLKVLRDFGLVMACAFLILGAILLWRHRPSAPFLIYIGLTFGLLGFLAPQWLNRAEVLWLKFGERLSVVVTFLILTLTYYLAVTPLALFLRLLGKDLLKLEIDKDAPSYWIPVPADHPGTRPFKPY